jgi:hypothetical protein
MTRAGEKVLPYHVDKLAEMNRANAAEFAALKRDTAAGVRWPAARLRKLQRAAKRADRLAKMVDKGLRRGDLEAFGFKALGPAS